MRNKFLLSILAMAVQICSPVFAQTTISGATPNTYLIETPASITSAGGTTTLTSASKTIQVITGTTTQTITLPAATGLKVGRYFEFFNQSTGLVTINANGGSLLKNLAPNEKSIMRLTDNGTSAGSWAIENNAAAINIAQPFFAGSAYIAPTASCTWSRSSATMGSFPTVAACPGPTVELAGDGQEIIQTTDTDLPKFTVNNLRPGNCKVSMTISSGSSGPNHSAFAISDGTDVRGNSSSYTDVSNNLESNTIIAWFRYYVSGNRTFELLGAAATGTASVLNNGDSRKTIFEISCVPLQTQLAINVANLKNPTIQKFTSGSGTYTRPTGVTSIRVRLVGGGGGGAGGGNSGGNGTAGGTTTFGTSLLSGAGGSAGAGSAGAGGAGGAGSLGTGPSGTIITGAIGQSGGGAGNIGGSGGDTPFGGGGGGGASAGNATPNGSVGQSNTGGGGGGGSGNGVNSGGGGGGGGFVDAIISSPDATYAYCIGNSGAACTGGGGGTGNTGGNGGAGGSGYIEVTEYYGYNMPPVIGAISTASPLLERIERIHVDSSCSSSPCTIAGRSNTGLTVTRSGAGGYSLVIAAGVFSAAPSCNLTCNFGAPCVATVQGNMTTTGFSFVTVRTDTNAQSDSGFQIICMGPKG